MNLIAALLAASLVAIVDQLIKSHIVARLDAHALVTVGPVGIRNVVNEKTRGSRPVVWIVLLGTEAVWLLALVQLVPAFHNPLAAAALGVALGGAAGNVLDRVRRGGVVDYIDLGFWPIFNFADLAIVLGVGLFLLTL